MSATGFEGAYLSYSFTSPSPLASDVLQFFTEQPGPDGAFSVSGGDVGVLTVTNKTIRFEMQPSFGIAFAPDETITISDAGGTVPDIIGFTLDTDVVGLSVNDISFTTNSITLTMPTAINWYAGRYLEITVEFPNNAPYFTSSNHQSINENETYVTAIAATDPDGDVLNYSIVGGDDAALFVIDPTNGALSFKVAPDFEAPNSVGGDNNYKIQVRVSDGTLDNTQDITVTVNDVYEAPPNSVPRFTGPSALNIRENQTLVATLAARDPDGDALRYSIAGGDDAALFSINSKTGALSFINPPDFEAPNSADGTNAYDVRIRVSDGTDSASRLFTVTVTDTAEIARFFNINTGTHFYTADSTERDRLIATNADYVFEGETFSTAATDADGVSVYRFFNTLTGGHFYTADADEAASVRADLPQFSHEGQAFMAYDGAGSDRQAVHRFYNVETKAHFYTNDEAERDNVMTSLPQYNYEGVAFYVDLV